MDIPELKSNFRELNDILHAGYAPNVISTAIKLGLFDVLFEEPMDARTLSDRLGTVYEITEAFANALVALNLLAKTGADYSLAPLSKDFLVKSSPAYQGEMIAMTSQYGEIMETMPETLKNGPLDAFDSGMWASAEFMKIRGQGAMGGSIQDVTEFISALPEFPDLLKMDGSTRVSFLRQESWGNNK
ncbi:MAG: methyltransferase dimerization domain-containing protein [Euryarchaeota archaeon]|nr:methyltransferase dimerization domain-containing protein [Euryarchaeota archaeon]